MDLENLSDGLFFFLLFLVQFWLLFSCECRKNLILIVILGYKLKKGLISFCIFWALENVGFLQMIAEVLALVGYRVEKGVEFLEIVRLCWDWLVKIAVDNRSFG